MKGKAAEILSLFRRLKQNVKPFAGLLFMLSNNPAALARGYGNAEEQRALAQTITVRKVWLKPFTRFFFAPS